MAIEYRTVYGTKLFKPGSALIVDFDVPSGGFGSSNCSFVQGFIIGSMF